MRKKPSIEEKQARKICDQSGVPYWEDHGDYPKGEKVSDEEWRWEFLRRDWQYRDDWEKFSIGEFSEIRPEHLIEYGLIELQDPTKSYRKLSTKMVFQMYPAILDARGDIQWGYYEVSEKQDEDIFTLLESERDRDNLISVKFDLTRPLSPQIARLKKPLEDKQKRFLGRILRLRISDDPSLYLRALDARRVGVDPTAIGKKIFGCVTTHSAATRGRQALSKARKMWRDF